MAKGPTIHHNGTDYTLGTNHESGEPQVTVHTPGYGTVELTLTPEDLTNLALHDSETIVRVFGDKWLDNSGFVGKPFTNFDR